MKKVSLALCSILLVAMMSGPARADSPTPTPVAAPNALSKPIQALVDTYIKGDTHVPGLAVGVIEVDGDSPARYSAGFVGVASKDTNQPPTASTLFEIGSETKLFTATVLAYMVNSGKMKLDDPIEKYLPTDVKTPTFNGKSITLLDLATHRSGLPDTPDNKPKNELAPYPLKDFYAWLSGYKLTSAPGITWLYSNTGFGLLGVLISRATGLTYDALIQKYFNTPLNMPDTLQFPSNAQKARLAVGYDPKGDPATPFYKREGGQSARETDSLVGAGQLYSTLTDMFQFAAANLDLVGDAETQAAFDSTLKVYADAGNATAKMGLGWQMTAPQGNTNTRIVWKDGLTDGFHSYIALFKAKNKRYAVILLGNGRTKDGLEPLGGHIIKQLIGA